jgi:hypothetical protein
MDVRRFVAIRRVEEQPVWPEPNNRWQRISVYTVDGRIATPHGALGRLTASRAGTAHPLRN